jgi:flagellar biosynthesis chaperone FliJ
VRSLTYTCGRVLSSAEHEHDKVAWAVEKQAFEEHVQQLTDEGEGLRNDLKAKGVELEELAQAKQKMMKDYEQTIAQQTEAFEARISTLESERNELLEYKVTL